MSANAARVSPSGADNTQVRSRNLAKRDPRSRDLLLDSVGRQRSAIPLKASRVAEIVDHSETQESRIRSGRRMSAMGRAAVAIHEAAVSEALPLERAAEVSAYVEVILRTVAMIPELEKLTTPELLKELREEIVRTETRANGLCNNLEAEFLSGEPLSDERLHGLLDGHTQQAAASVRISAILQVLAQRMK